MRVAEDEFGFAPLDRDAGVVPDPGTQAREGVEERRLPGVRAAEQAEDERVGGAFRDRQTRHALPVCARVRALNRGVECAVSASGDTRTRALSVRRRQSW